MPLSEHEQRMLEQIEQALYAEDPKFAHAVRSTNPQVHYKRRIVKAALGFVVGVCALMTGLVMNAGTVTIAVSVTGFLLMVVCCVWALTSWKRMTGVGAEQAAPGGDAGGGGQGRRRERSSKPGFMDRMEERWRRRTEGE
ncbi:spore wall synthesis complex protein [Actinomadura vinacea]|uniref:Spore wall synthesis complex protein n=1 Tax=Actinomadura vinacea TaxID=115336 RepID=A0ABN3IKP7_9ACTN